MIQFSFNRFAKLARWSLTNDKKYHVKSLLQMFIVLVLLFVFFTINPNRIVMAQQSVGYQACAIGTVAIFLVGIVMGSSFMFYSMDGKHDMQALLLLPASNFEKYLMRYSSWMILIPLNLVAFFAADLVQYLVNVLMGHDYATFVSTTFVGMVSNIWNKIAIDSRCGFVSLMILIAVWLHSLYALGATFFRSHKYNWIFSTLIIVALLILFVVIDSIMGDQSFDINTKTIEFMVNIVVVILLVMFNFWMSYRFFCRQQVIGKLVNL